MPKLGYKPAGFPDGTRRMGGFYPYRYSGTPENGILDSSVDFHSFGGSDPGKAIASCINDCQQQMAVKNGVTNTPPIFVFWINVFYDAPLAQYTATIGYCLTPGDMDGTRQDEGAFGVFGTPPEQLFDPVTGF